jgi:rare lipoprotein A
VVVRVNDRGPFEDGASLQVSRQVARELGFEAAGKAALTMRLVGNAPAAVAEIKTPVVAEPKLLRAAASLPAQQPSEELYGDDELAGGATWTPAPAKARAEVKWPEPPADWDVAPAKATKVAAPKVTAAPSGTMYVQLASFSDIGNAEALYSGLKGDLPVEIVPARVNGTDYFRVRVGPLASRSDAQELRDRLNAEGKGDGRVVSAE